MKKTLSLLLATAMVVMSGSRAWATDYWSNGPLWNGQAGTAGAAKAGAAANPDHWMAYIPDNVYVAHLSIPGTHDTMTGYDWLSFGLNVVTANWNSVTQSRTLHTVYNADASANETGQLPGGIRAFDFRPGMRDGKLYCGHGLSLTDRTMDDAFKELTEYLDSHPSEFFIIHLFRGNVYRSGQLPSGASLLGGSEDTAGYATLMQKFFSTGNTTTNANGHTFGTYFIDFNPRLKVSDVRGKIIVTRRENIDWVNIPFAGYLNNWDTQFNVNNPASITWAQNPARQATLHMQDISNAKNATGDNSMWQKQDHCLALMNYGATQAKPSTISAGDRTNYKPFWMMNFTSSEYNGPDGMDATTFRPTGSGDEYSGTNSYKCAAKFMNHFVPKAIGEMTTKGPIGIFFSDYVLCEDTKEEGMGKSYRFPVNGTQMVQSIVANNFDYLWDYTLDNTFPDIHSSFTNPYAGKKYFIRSVQHGEYLCGGANYGSHAALDPHGYIFEIGMDPSSGEVTLHAFSGVNGSHDVGYLKVPDYCWIDGSAGDAKPFLMKSGTTPGSVVFTYNNGAKCLDTYAYTAASDYTPVAGVPDGDWRSTASYYDNLKYWVDPNDYVPGNAWQEWELIPYEERYAQDVADANPDRGIDMTYLLEGYNFGNGNNGGWSFAGHKYIGSTAAHGGQEANSDGGMYRCYNNKITLSGGGSRAEWTLEKTFSGLPNGTYTLQFQALADRREIKWWVNDVAQTDINNHYIDATGDHTYDSDNTGLDVVAGPEFKQNACWRSVNLTVTDGTLKLKFEHHDSNSSPTAFYLDNLHLTYYGAADKAMDNIVLDFPNKYNTMILPFDVPSVPQGIFVFEALNTKHNDNGDIHKGYFYGDGHVENGEVVFPEYNVVLLGETVSSIAANTPYVVMPVQTVSQRQQARARTTDGSGVLTDAATNTYTFTGYPRNTESEYTHGLLTGTLKGGVLSGSQMPLETAYGLQAFDAGSGSQRTIAPYRAYLDMQNGTVSANVNAPDVIFEDGDRFVTGLENVKAEGEAAFDAGAEAEIYTVGGMYLGRDIPGEALRSFAPGIYILRQGSAVRKVKL